MNILILSCGTRNLLVRYFKDRRNGFDKVVGTDCSTYAPALYETDSHYIVPCMTAPDYLDVILDICRRESIRMVLPLQEDELDLSTEQGAFYRDRGAALCLRSPDGRALPGQICLLPASLLASPPHCYKL